MSSIKSLLEEIRKIPTSSLSDALDQAGIRGFMSHEIRPRVGNAKIVGFAVTVKDVPSKKKIPPLEALEAIDKAKPGDIFVRAIECVDADSSNVALIGGLMALGAKKKGLAGAVIDGGARDIAECEEIEFQVFSRSIVPSTSVGRTEVVGVDVPIYCGGVLVNPGDLIVGDRDGVVVIPKEKLEQILKTAKDMDEKERRVSEELKMGRPLLETVKKYSRI